MAEEIPQGGNPAEALQKLLDKHKGDAMALAMTLLSENFGLREKNRTLKEQIPTADSVVLTKEQGAEYDAAKSVVQILSDLKVKPEELKDRIEGAAKENARLKREAERNALVELGYSSASLSDFDELEGAAIESYFVKDEQKDGKAVKTPYVKVGGAERSFDEYAKEKRPALASVLKSDASAAQGGVAYVPQSPGGNAPAPQTKEQLIAEEKRKARASGQYAL
jgi:hypothetical protein